MNDPEIREKFKEKFLDRFNRANCLIFDELGIMQGSSIVDLALLTPAYFQGFEIKSAEDTLVRLPNQIEKYNQIFDYITIITEEHYYFQVKNLVPPFWGIMIAQKIQGQVFFNYSRQPVANSHTTKEAISQLLWKDEVYAILREHKVKGISKFNRNQLWKVLTDTFSKEEIKTMVWQTLQKRLDWKKSF